MVDTLREIIRGALERLTLQLRTDLPPFLAALIILAAAFAAAWFCRWLVTRIFKGIEVDRWLRRSGLPEVLHLSGHMRTSRIAARAAFWSVLVVGFLLAINVFGSQFTSHIVESAVLLLPRIVMGGAIVLGGLWMAQYLGRGTLIWAVNEDLPSPRKLAMAVRSMVTFAAVVIAAEIVNFAPAVFFAAFVLVVGGIVLTASLALGLGARDTVRRYLERRETAPAQHNGEPSGVRSLWEHL
jgi:hypothetical protein